MKMQPAAILISARISLLAESLIQPKQQPNWHPEHRYNLSLGAASCALACLGQAGQLWWET